MAVGFHATKLIVRDRDAAERFYEAIGMKVVSRNVGGEGNVRQSQSWLSESGDMSTHVLILSQFLEVAAPPHPTYPTEAWLALTVPDVDATAEAAKKLGGKVLRTGQDRPEHNVRAGMVADLDGHIIELVGPMTGKPWSGN